MLCTEIVFDIQNNLCTQHVTVLIDVLCEKRKSREMKTCNNLLILPLLMVVVLIHRINCSGMNWIIKFWNNYFFVKAGLFAEIRIMTKVWAEFQPQGKHRLFLISFKLVNSILHFIFTEQFQPFFQPYNILTRILEPRWPAWGNWLHRLLFFFTMFIYSV